MDQGDGTPGANLTLADSYRQLMELDSISQALTEQIYSAQRQSITAQHVVSSSGTEGHWPSPDDWPGDFFENLVHELKQARCKVESLHDSMREVAHASSRSRIRPLNILDLPNELLRKIFEQSRNQWGPWASSEDYFWIPNYDNRGGVKDIKNIRLTCRRFCNTSSHLLLRHVDVTMSPPSIAHLEEVARHPLISYGVQAVRVHLNYFSAELATDITRFTVLAAGYLEIALDAQRTLFAPGDEEFFGVLREALGPAIEKAELILAEWVDFLQRAGDLVEGPDILEEAIARSKGVAGLVKAHEIYRQKYLAQESVLKDGTFTRAITSAMSKMPTATRFFVGDLFRDFENGKYDYTKTLVDGVEDPECLATSWMVRPQYWDSTRAEQGDDQPKEILLHLLLAVFKNGNSINHLSVKLSPAIDLSIPATQEQLQQLTAGTEHLRVFHFHGSASDTYRLPPVDHGPKQIASFGLFVSACMGGKALRRLDVNLSFALDGFSPRPPVSMGALLAPRQCPGLKTLKLTDYPLHLNELKRFLGCLNGPLYIDLSDVLLLSGTWAEALDLIRDKADRNSFVTRLRGAECDEMLEEEMLAIFGKDRVPSFGKEGKATHYIRGYVEDNPLRTRESAGVS